MDKFTHAENADMIVKLTARARAIGFIEENDTIIYEKGNVARGIGSYLWIARKREDGQYERLPRPEWLPEFATKDGPSVLGNMIVAFGEVIQFLYAQQIKREGEERRRKMSYLAEHTARRSE